MMKTVFTKEEIAQHSSPNDLWIVVDSVVYDLSKFSSIHPGGVSVLFDEEIAGKDATEAFFSLHRQEVLEKPQYARLRIGTVEGGVAKVKRGGRESLSEVPYAEPVWLRKGYHSPYYSDSHRRFQGAVRKFVQEVVFPDAQAREEDGKPPSQSVLDAMAKMNIIAMRLGPGKHLKGRVLMGGVIQPEEFDQFHELIMWQEFARIHARGYNDGLGGGTCIALPPVLNFGSEELKKAVVEDIFGGKKTICLAVTEAFAGSDVAGLKCHAKAMETGWIEGNVLPNTLQNRLLTAMQKWITNGTFADYFTTACRTDEGKIVVLLIPRQEGVLTRLIRTSYSASAGTAFIEFTNVYVPKVNQLGVGRDGLHVILSNFNHERWAIITWSIGVQRVITEECLKYVTLRKVFGKPLSSQPVIRAKLAAMISRFESCQTWLENITYQMKHMDYSQQANELAGPIALLKMFTTGAAQDTARDAVQIFGGRGITRSGMGKFIEHYHRTLLIDAVGGGAEDIMADLGIRQALRKMPKSVRL
ncbi:acyl-CoA dehydrogenase [Pholiota conissans]|uniref:Acyl-CoA dehydrogenase n=1 Tax=Pholiota conissans TaxID=109636 RepID=A0A9P5YVS6_9AGAR|nr:acyl-CoA dehydrogenase [Pholiota conissans]